MVSAGGTAQINFKNVFNGPQDFVFIVDDPCFSVTPAQQTLDANKTVTLAVKFTPSEGEAKDGEAVNAKLLASIPSMEDLPPWIFYLSGLSA